jgi:hypothetical protein
MPTLASLVIRARARTHVLALLLPLALATCSGKLPTVPTPAAPPVTLRFDARDAGSNDFALPDGAPRERPYQQFDVADVRARLGARLHGDQVELRDGRKMPLADFVKLVNDYERFFTSLGTSLREPDDDRVLLALKPRASLAGTPSPGTGVDPDEPADGGTARGHSSCLFKGTLNVKWRDATDCLPADAANDGWFGVDIRGAFTAMFEWNARDEAFSLHAWQNLLVDVVLFGARLDGAKLHSDVDWVKFKGERGLGPQPGASYGLRGQTQSRPEAEAVLDPLRVELAFGPETLRLQPAARVFAAIGRTQVPMTPYPEDCKASDTGTLKIESHPIVRITFAAGVPGDTGVSRYRLDGALTIADTAFDVTTDLAIRPAANELTVARAFTTRYKHLEGALELLVDTDLGFAHKRWRVQLVRGAARSGARTVTLAPRTFSAE